MNSVFDNHFQLIDNLPYDESRQNMVDFLQMQAAVLRDQPDDAPRIAYNIAGLMATDFARKLADNDPLSVVMTIAGELEIDPPDADSLRLELIQAIELL